MPRGMTDALTLAQALIRSDSVTPARGSVFDVLEAALVPLGFAVDRFTIGEEPDGPVENLLATRGRSDRSTPRNRAGCRLPPPWRGRGPSR